jgi:hypothetical protein
MLTLLALLAPQALAVPCAAHVEGQRVLLAEPIAFQARGAELAPESAGPVRGIACLLGEQPELVLQVEVHTDARGSERYNLNISQHRADAIVVALLAEGVAAERLTGLGRGESMPVEHEDWATSQALSRRVELWLDPAARPPAPVLAPPPEPVPAAPTPQPPSLCDALAGWTGEAPQLPGASACEPSTTGWACFYSEGPATLSPRVQACVGGDRDGDELYTDWRGGTLSVRFDPDRSGRTVVSYIPHIR